MEAGWEAAWLESISPMAVTGCSVASAPHWLVVVSSLFPLRAVSHLLWSSWRSHLPSHHRPTERISSLTISYGHLTLGPFSNETVKQSSAVTCQWTVTLCRFTILHTLFHPADHILFYCLPCEVKIYLRWLLRSHKYYESPHSAAVEQHYCSKLPNSLFLLLLCSIKPFSLL